MDGRLEGISASSYLRKNNYNMSTIKNNLLVSKEAVFGFTDGVWHRLITDNEGIANSQVVSSSVDRK
jgi:hypothetical protein